MANGEMKVRGIHPMNRHLYHPHMTIVQLPKGHHDLEAKIAELEPTLMLDARQDITG